MFLDVQAVESSPSAGNPRSDTPASASPASSSPASAEPASSSPASAEPVSVSPASAEPASAEPASAAPESAAPESAAPASAAPASAAPASPTPTKDYSEGEVPLKKSLDYNNGRFLDVFTLEYSDIKKFSTYEEEGERYNPTSITFGVTNSRSETTNIDKVQYNSILSEGLQNNIWKVMCQDFDSDEIKDDKDNWSVVCFTSLEENKMENTAALIVYPMFVHCRLSSVDNNVTDFGLHADGIERNLDNSYDFDTILGTELKWETADKVEFKNKEEGKSYSIHIKDKTITVRMQVGQALLNIKTEYEGNVEDIDGIKYIHKYSADSRINAKVKIEGNADVMRALAKKLLGENYQTGGYEFTNAELKWNTKDYFVNITDSKKAAIRQMATSTADRLSLELSYKMADGKYLPEDYKIILGLKADDRELSREVNLCNDSTIIVDTENPKLTVGSWNWIQEDEQTFLKSSFKVEDKNVVNSDRTMYWYIEYNKILISDVKPDDSKNPVRFTAVYDADNDSYLIQLDCNTDAYKNIALEGKPYSISFTDMAMNTGVYEADKLKLDEMLIDMSLDNTLVNFDNTYYVADLSRTINGITEKADVTRYNISKDGDTIQKNQVTNLDNFIQEVGEGEHSIRLTAYCQDINRDSSYFLMKKTNSIFTNKETKINFSDIQPVVVGGRTAYSYTFGFQEYGEYNFSIHIVDNKNNELDTTKGKSINVLYDMTSPDTNIERADVTTKEKPWWDIFGLFVTEKEETVYTVTLTEEGTPITHYGAMQSDKLLTMQNSTYSPYRCTYQVKLGADNNKSIEFVANNKFGLMSDPSYNVIVDDEAPVVDFLCKKSGEDTFTKCEEQVKVDSTDSIKVAINEMYFYQVDVYVLSESELAAFDIASHYDAFQSQKVNQSWTEESDGTIHSMTINLAPYYQGKGDQYRYIKVVGKDIAGNRIVENTTLKLDPDKNPPTIKLIKNPSSDNVEILRDIVYVKSRDNIEIDITDDNLDLHNTKAYLMTAIKYKSYKAGLTDLEGTIQPEFTQDSNNLCRSVLEMGDLVDQVMYLLIKASDSSGNSVGDGRVVTIKTDNVPPIVDIVNKTEDVKHDFTYTAKFDGQQSDSPVYKKIKDLDIYQEDKSGGAHIRFSVKDTDLFLVDKQLTGDEIYNYMKEKICSLVYINANMIQLKSASNDISTFSEMNKQRNWSPNDDSRFTLKLIDFEVDSNKTYTEKELSTVGGEIPVIEKDSLITNCTLEVTLGKGYYENFEFRVKDTAGNERNNEHYYTEGYNKNFTEINEAFCVKGLSDDKDAAINVIEPADTVFPGNPSEPLVGKNYRVNVMIPDQNICSATLKVITKKEEDKPKESEEVIMYGLNRVEQPGQYVWKYDDNIYLDGDKFYTLELTYKDFLGEEHVVSRNVVTDNTNPFITASSATKSSNGEPIELITKHECGKLYGHYYDFAMGKAGLILKFSISDLHLKQEVAEKSNIQIYRLPNDLNEFEGDLYDSNNWEDISTCKNKDGEPLVETEYEYISGLPESTGYETEERLQDSIYNMYLNFTESGRYLVKVTCSDDAGNGNTVWNYGIVIDKLPPSSAKISFDNLKGFKEQKLDAKPDMSTVLSEAEKASDNNVYIGTDKVTLKLTAEDDCSNEFDVKAHLYPYAYNESTKKYEYKDAPSDEIELKWDSDEKVYSEIIDKSFQGMILYSIADMAGNISYVAVGRVVIDLVKADVFISSVPDNGKGTGGKYYTAKKFTVKVTDNFWDAGDLTISDSFWNAIDPKQEEHRGVLKLTLDTSEKATTSKVQNSCGQVEKCGVHYYTIDLGKNVSVKDGLYKFKLKYKEDGRTDQYYSSEFYMDRTKPVLSNVYSNNNLYNKMYYKHSQKATLTLKEAYPVLTGEVASIEKNGEKIAECSIDGKETSNNVKVYNADKTQAKNGIYKFNVPFNEDGYYKYDIKSSDLAGNISSTQNKSFVIDKEAPSVKLVKVTNKNQGTLQKIFHYVTFGYFFKASVEVQVEALDETSGVQKLIYYTVDEKDGKSKEITVSGSKIPYSAIGKEGTGEKYKLKKKIELSPDFKGKVYVKAVDFSENVSNSGKFQECGSLILKKQSSSDAAIEIKSLSEPNENGFYNKDFKVKLTAHENYDGIHTLDYSAGALVKGEEDFSTKTEKKTPIIYKWSKTININAKANDDNNVKVRLSYQDNTGNRVVKKEETYKVDVTKPVLSVTYDNQAAQKETYYKENRTATIRIDELNFKPNDVIIKITRNGRTVTNMRPANSAWSKRGITHTARIVFSEDGDYEFSVEFTDLAGNKADYTHNDKFTVDKTKPEVAVSYSNNNVQGKQYYNKARTATVTVNEHNFDASAVKVNIKRKDKSGAGVPRLGNWTSNGDRHTATVAFNSDGVYGIQVSSSDTAGNAAEDVKEQTFTIDQTKPELKISGVKSSTAYGGRVVPVLTYTDTNLNEGAVSVTVTGYKNGKVNVKYKESTVSNGKIRSLDMFPQKKNVDDVYTMNVKVVDKAGNSVNKKMSFSVNRFGSNYTVDDASTASVLNSYTKDEKDIVIEEVNVRDLKKYAVTCSKDGTITTLKEGEDYHVDVANSEYNWKKYTYTVLAKNFTSEGNYSICISSTDGAGNVSNNEEKKQELRFTIDKTAPTLTTAGIENNKIYNASVGNLDMIVNDNIIVNQVKLYLNDKEIKNWSQKDIEKDFGQLKADIPGKDSRQQIKIAIKDEAGNENEYNINNFLITQNRWIQFYNNKKAVVATVGGTGGMLAVICLILLRRRRG